jgi:hypothetical protein
MDDAHEERFRQHEDLMGRLAVLLAAQHDINEELRAANQRHDAINERLTVAIEELKGINQDVKTTLARIETLLARMIRHEDNGRDA